MRSAIRALLLVTAALIPASNGTAGIDQDDASIPKLTSYELVVMEADGCTYCSLFRRDVLPSYKNSERAKDVPIRFVDVNDVPASKIELETPIDIVPTFVVLKGNKEVGRIPGYTGPENFFHTINYIIGSAP
jgi:thioredoxin-related protein